MVLATCLKFQQEVDLLLLEDPEYVNHNKLHQFRSRSEIIHLHCENPVHLPKNNFLIRLLKKIIKFKSNKLWLTFLLFFKVKAKRPLLGK